MALRADSYELKEKIKGGHIGERAGLKKGENMNIEYITCSDMREHNDIDEIISLGKKYPMAEFAIQAHPSKFSQHMSRYVWFDTLVHAARVNKMNLAMHVNAEYRTELCFGNIPYSLRRLWEIRRDDNTPVISRVQVNINGGNDKFDFYPDKVANIIRAYPGIKFIFQYAPAQYERIRQLAKQNVPFALLYDVSGGEGKLSRDSWGGIILPAHQTGYAGGLSPDNVVENLNYINTLLPANYDTWIDAEGKLKSPDDNGKKLFDTTLAEKYIVRAIAWQMKYGYKK